MDQAACSTRPGVAPGLDDLIEHPAILIDGAPQPVLLAGDGHDDFIKMSNVMPGDLRQATGKSGPNFFAQRRIVSYETPLRRSRNIFLPLCAGSTESEGTARPHGR